MTDQKFILSFLITIMLAAIVLYLCHTSSAMAPFIDIGIYAAGIFSMLSVGVYILTKYMSKTKKKVMFIQVILSNMLTKMILSAVIVTIYFMVKAPDDGIFIVPFLLVYVLFTVFETYFMNEQAKAR